MIRGASRCFAHAAVSTNGSNEPMWFAARINDPARTSAGMSPVTRSRHSGETTVGAMNNAARHNQGARHRGGSVAAVSGTDIAGSVRRGRQVGQASFDLGQLGAQPLGLCLGLGPLGLDDLLHRLLYTRHVQQRDHPQRLSGLDHIGFGQRLRALLGADQPVAVGVGQRHGQRRRVA